MEDLNESYLKAGTVINNGRYFIIGELGNGNYGNVYEGEDHFQ